MKIYRKFSRRDYFEFLCDADRAYMLGLLVSDGGLSGAGRGNYDIYWKGGPTEKGRIEWIKEKLEAENKISWCKSTHTWTLSIYSEQMFNGLLRIGLEPHSDIKDTFRDYIKGFEKEFLLGMIEGDGHFHQKPYMCLSQYNKPVLVSLLVEIIEENNFKVSRSVPRLKGNSIIYEIYVLGIENCTRFVNWLYSGVEGLWVGKKNQAFEAISEESMQSYREYEKSRYWRDVEKSRKCYREKYRRNLKGYRELGRERSRKWRVKVGVGSEKISE